SFAIKNISLDIEPGRIFTLLGRNGAGKTTFVRICATQLLPTSGTVKIFDNDLIKDTEKIRNYISIVPQEGRPLRALTPWRLEEHTSELQSHRDLHSCPTRRSSDLVKIFDNDLIKDTEKIRNYISIVPQEGRPLRALTPW